MNATAYGLVPSHWLAKLPSNSRMVFHLQTSPSIEQVCYLCQNRWINNNAGDLPPRDCCVLQAKTSIKPTLWVGGWAWRNFMHLKEHGNKFLKFFSYSEKEFSHSNIHIPKWIAASFLRAKRCIQLQCALTGEWISKTFFYKQMENCSALKKNEIWTHTKTWIILLGRIIVLYKVPTPPKSIDTENRMTLTRNGSEERGVLMYGSRHSA